MRASPVTFSERTGLRLCGIAEEPFGLSEKIFFGLENFGPLQMANFVASRSIEDATTPRVAKYIA